jgi:dGTPase
MERPGTEERYAKERDLVAELVEAVAAGAPQTLDPVHAAWFEAAGDDAARLRVVIDRVAALTDTSAMALHHRLCGSGPPA